MSNNISGLLQLTRKKLDLLNKDPYVYMMSYNNITEAILLNPVEIREEKEILKKQIAELEIKEAEQKDKGNITTTQENIKTELRLGDIVIIPGVCIIIGNYAISNYDTYKKMVDLFEKGIGLYNEKDGKQRTKILRSGQFSSGLKFLYAVVKYISSEKIKIKDNLYLLSCDEKFASYIKEAGKKFDFITKTNTDTKGKGLDYWKGPRNHCNKILLRCSEVISIDAKKGGKKEISFCVRNEIK